MNMTIIAVLIFAVSFITTLLFGIILISKLRTVIGFNNSKIAEATIIDFKGYTSHSNDVAIGDITTHSPIINYFNEFLNDNIERVLVGSGIIHPDDAITNNEKHRVANVGDKVKIEYTDKKERVIDERFVSRNKYKLFNVILPLMISIFMMFVSIILLIISII